MSPNQIKCLVYQLFTVPMAKTKQKPSQILRQIQRATKKKNKENIENGRREGASSMSRKSFSFYTRRPPTERKKQKPQPAAGTPPLLARP